MLLGGPYYSALPTYRLHGLQVGFDAAAVKSSVFRLLVMVLNSEMMIAPLGYIGSLDVIKIQ